MTGDDYRARLREARLHRSLDQQQLASITGLSTTTISAVERGQRDITAPKLFAWARACGVSLDDIAGDAIVDPVSDPTLVALDLQVTA